MGITLAAAEFLAEAAARGVSFDRTLTVGRQWLVVGPDRVWPVLQKHGIQPTVSKGTFRRQLGWQPWSDPFFRLLGANEVDSIDASGYEGASIVHDLNEPVPEALRARFDVVVDCGTLEHIFNVPVALKNYMELVRVGGRLILVLPANNEFGHGFYQFSAELFYSALSEQNGYAIERMLIYYDDYATIHRSRGRTQFSAHHGPRYEVADPRVVGQRVVLQGGRENMLMVLAKRTAQKGVFGEPPEQSDYVAIWAADRASKDGSPTNTTRTRLGRWLPSGVRERVTQPALLWLHWDGLPRVLPLLDPFARRRTRREWSVTNRRLFRRLD